MTTLREIEDQLPWGLHDAYLERLEVDWARKQVVVEARLQIDAHQETERLARIIVTGLCFFVAAKPNVLPDSDPPADIPWIDGGEGRVPKDATELPPVPDGAFLHHIVLRYWQYLYICAREAVLTWIDPAPVPSRSNMGAAFPGESIPDPTHIGRRR